MEKAKLTSDKNEKMELELTSDKNNVYKITIEHISEKIPFQVESKDIPKKLIKKGFSYEDMRKDCSFFNNNNYQNIEDIYDQLKKLIEHYKKKASDELKCELKEDDEKIELIIEIGAGYLLFGYIKCIDILFPKTIDVDSTLSELISLYQTLKKEKDDEINNLNKKLNESELKYNELANEIKKLKDEYNKEINELKSEIKNLKEENKKLDIKTKDLKNDIINNSDNINELRNKLEKYISNTKENLIFLAYNNSENFKNIFELYYKKIQKVKTFFLTEEEKYKTSYDSIVDCIFNTVTGKNGDEPNKVIEFESNYDYKKYKKYDANEWNWFIINNVIFQMMFSNDIELDVNGVKQTLEKIYKLRPEFKEDYKFDLERQEFDIIRYIWEFKICQIIKGIKEHLMPKLNFLSKLKEYLLDSC